MEDWESDPEWSLQTVLDLITSDADDILSHKRRKTVCLLSKYFPKIQRSWNSYKNSSWRIFAREIKSYPLVPGRSLNQSEIKTIFYLRFRNMMLKCNFPGILKNVNCVAKICSDKDTQEHIYSCIHLGNQNLPPKDSVPFVEIFSESPAILKYIQE